MRVTLGVIWLSILFQTATCSTRSYVIGEFRRDSDKPIYKIHFPSIGQYETPFNPPKNSIPKGLTEMRMVTARGQVMRCLLPKQSRNENAKYRKKPKPTTTKEGEEDTRFADIDEILNAYNDQCFFRKDGWWTYEFCYNRHIVQKHLIPPDQDPVQDEEEIEIVLGVFDRDSDLIRRKNSTLVSMSDSAFTQLYANGTECDLTGVQRQVIIKYMCSDDALRSVEVNMNGKNKHKDLNVLNRVREVESCVYEVEFLNSAICHHSTYKEKTRNSVKPIHCSLDTDQTPFEGLYSPDYHRASLSL